MTKPDAMSRDTTRILSVLAVGPLYVRELKDGVFGLSSDSGEHYTFSDKALASLVRRGLINRSGSAIKLSETGRSAAKRMLATEDRFLSQHGELAQRVNDRGIGTPYFHVKGTPFVGW